MHASVHNSTVYSSLWGQTFDDTSLLNVWPVRLSLQKKKLVETGTAIIAEIL